MGKCPGCRSDEAWFGNGWLVLIVGCISAWPGSGPRHGFRNAAEGIFGGEGSWCLVRCVALVISQCLVGIRTKSKHGLADLSRQPQRLAVLVEVFRIEKQGNLHIELPCELEYGMKKLKYIKHSRAFVNFLVPKGDPWKPGFRVAEEDEGT